MQSSIHSFSRLVMASKRMKTFIFKNVIKIKYEEVNYLVPDFTPPPAQVELAALFLVAKKKLSDEAKKDSILCKKTWGIQP